MTAATPTGSASLTSVLHRHPGSYGWATEHGVYARNPRTTPPLIAHAADTASLEHAISAAETTSNTPARRE